MQGITSEIFVDPQLNSPFRDNFSNFDAVPFILSSLSYADLARLTLRLLGGHAVCAPHVSINTNCLFLLFIHTLNFRRCQLSKFVPCVSCLGMSVYRPT